MVGVATATAPPRRLFPGRRGHGGGHRRHATATAAAVGAAAGGPGAMRRPLTHRCHRSVHPLGTASPTSSPARRRNLALPVCRTDPPQRRCTRRRPRRARRRRRRPKPTAPPTAATSAGPGIRQPTLSLLMPPFALRCRHPTPPRRRGIAKATPRRGTPSAPPGDGPPLSKGPTASARTDTAPPPSQHHATTDCSASDVGTRLQFPSIFGATRLHGCAATRSSKDGCFQAYLPALVDAPQPLPLRLVWDP